MATRNRLVQQVYDTLAATGGAITIDEVGEVVDALIEQGEVKVRLDEPETVGSVVQARLDSDPDGSPVLWTRFSRTATLPWINESGYATNWAGLRGAKLP